MDNKTITKEQARGILEDYLVQRAKEKASKLEIRDFQPDDGYGVYSADRITNCFIVDVPDDSHFCIGASRMIAISKETGKIIIDGRFGE